MNEAAKRDHVCQIYWEARLSLLKLLIMLFVIAAIVAVLHFRWDLFRRKFHPWLENNATLLGAYRSLGWLLTVPIVLVGGYLGFLQLRDAISAPNVALAFGSPIDPRFVVVNPSPRVVKEPKYQFLLYNLSLPGNPEPYLNLEIPVKIMDFAHPGRGLGPWTIKSVSRHGNRIESGHYLFGYAEIQCPTCEQVHSYWVFVHVGSAGWYAEIPADQTKSIEQDLAAIVFGGPDYLGKIEKLVPHRRRISMEDRI